MAGGAAAVLRREIGGVVGCYVKETGGSTSGNVTSADFAHAR